MKKFLCLVLFLTLCGLAQAKDTAILQSSNGIAIGTANPMPVVIVSGSPGSDQSSSGLRITAVAGEALTIDDAIYPSTDGKFFKALADDESTVPVMGLSLTTASTGGAISVLKVGQYRDDSWTWTPGGLLYLSPSVAGGLTQTRPSASGDQVQIVGYAISATVIYFNPDYTYIEI